MRVSIMQPAFLPWLGYFNRLNLSDLHIVLDHVSFDANSKTKFTNRNKIRTQNGWAWITVPLRTKGLHGRAIINELKIGGEPGWADKMWRTIEGSYRKTPHFSLYGPALETELRKESGDFSRLAKGLTDTLLASLEIERPILFSSQLGVEGVKDDLILSLCRYVGATSYVSGPFGRTYITPEKFEAAGIELLFHDYVHPIYIQQHPGFEPYMSAIDLLFNVGADAAAVLRQPQTLSRG